MILREKEAVLIFVANIGTVAGLGTDPCVLEWVIV